MVAHSVVASLHTVPHLVATTVDNGDVNNGFVGLEHASHEICLGLRLKRYVEHALCPTLCGPSLRLAEIVDGSPVGESDDTVEVHLEEVRSHSGHGGLALVERHPREATTIAWEVHIAIVVGLPIGLHGKVAGQRVGIPVAIARMHGHSDKSCGIVTLDECLLQFEHGHAEVVERLVGILLQFVAKTPGHH